MLAHEYFEKNLQVYKHKGNNKLCNGQIQINAKHDIIFKTLNTKKKTFHTIQNV